MKLIIIIYNINKTFCFLIYNICQLKLISFNDDVYRSVPLIYLCHFFIPKYSSNYATYNNFLSKNFHFAYISGNRAMENRFLFLFPPLFLSGHTIVSFSADAKTKNTYATYTRRQRISIPFYTRTRVSFGNDGRGRGGDGLPAIKVRNGLSATIRVAQTH